MNTGLPHLRHDRHETAGTQPLPLSPPPKKFETKSLEPEYIQRLNDQEDGILPGIKYFLDNGDRFEAEITTTRRECRDSLVDIRSFHFRERENPEKRSVLFIFACNTKGAVLADRRAIFRLHRIAETGKVWKFASGMIMTGFRGIGLAHLIEDVHMVALQKEANRGVSVEWSISNQNAENLRAMEVASESDPSQGRKLAAYRKEQQRWQALYGKEGRLGFHENRKIFSPDNVLVMPRFLATQE